MNVINLLPYTVSVIIPGSPMRTRIFPPSGKLAELAPTDHYLIAQREGIFYRVVTNYEVVGLPPYDPIGTTVYIVSREIRLTFPHRRDLASPGNKVYGENNYADTNQKILLYHDGFEVNLQPVVP